MRRKTWKPWDEFIDESCKDDRDWVYGTILPNGRVLKFRTRDPYRKPMFGPIPKNAKLLTKENVTTSINVDDWNFLLLAKNLLQELLTEKREWSQGVRRVT